MVDLMVRPPIAGEPSFPRFQKERDDQLARLQSRATKLVGALNGMEGVTCNPAEGAMYAFPQIRLPPKALEAAAAAGKAADAMYCLSLLEATGICVVPGSGFGQEAGTLHFRTTFLPADDKIDEACAAMGAFHQGFMSQYQ